MPVKAIRDAGYAALRAVATPWKTFGSAGIRILAYHSVPDRDLFRRHMTHLVTHYYPVDSLNESAPAKPPVWVTFDDGDPSIIDVALPVLQEFGVAATAFICPGLIDSEEPYWWQVVESAIDTNVSVGGSRIAHDEISTLKALPDEQRRERVDEVRRSLEDRLGEPIRIRQLNTDEVKQWLASGHTVGNHTWDHPVLSNCTPDEQERQILLAHRWLEGRDMDTDLFAYPNGSWSRASQIALAEAGYTVGVLFDHGIADSTASLAMSRIRVNGTDSMNEFIAKVSGIHPAMHRVRRRA